MKFSSKEAHRRKIKLQIESIIDDFAAQYQTLKPKKQHKFIEALANQLVPIVDMLYIDKGANEKKNRHAEFIKLFADKVGITTDFTNG